MKSSSNPPHSQALPQEPLDPASLDWAALLQDRQWETVLVPYLQWLSSTLLDRMSETEDRDEHYLIGKQRAIVTGILSAPQDYLDAAERAALLEAQQEEAKEHAGGRNRRNDHFRKWYQSWRRQG